MIEQLLIAAPKSNLPVIPDNGPGPQNLMKYDELNDVGYFGTLTEAEFFTYTQVEAVAKTALPGTAANRTADNFWIKAYWKGKTVYMPRRVIRTGTTWTDIYKAGMVYGIDGDGRYIPPSGAVNQLTKITLTSANQTKFVFKVRMIGSYGIDPLPSILSSTQTALSEYTLIRERLLPANGAPAGWSWVTLGSIMGQTLGWETNPGTPVRAAMLNNNTNYCYRTLWDISTSSFCSFYPVLELIEIIKP